MLHEQQTVAPIRVPLIWEWSSAYQPSTLFEPTLLIPHIPCQRAHLQGRSQRLIYIVAEDSLSLHCLLLSVDHQPGHDDPYCTTVKHHFHQRNRDEVLGNSYLALRSYRGAWLSNDSDHHLTFETISFRDDNNHRKRFDRYTNDTDGYPVPIGSFSVDVGLSHLIDWDFDEVSGRFCLLVADPDDLVVKSVCLVDRACT